MRRLQTTDTPERRIKRAERLKVSLYSAMPVTCAALDMYIAAERAVDAATKAAERAWRTYVATLSIDNQQAKADVLRELRR